MILRPERKWYKSLSSIALLSICSHQPGRDQFSNHDSRAPGARYVRGLHALEGKTDLGTQRFRNDELLSFVQCRPERKTAMAEKNPIAELQPQFSSPDATPTPTSPIK